MFGGILTFTLALATSFGLTVPIRQIALRLGMVDHPSPRKVHRTPIPLLGGIAIYFGVVLSIILFGDGHTRGQIFGILAASTLLLVVGILDDRGLLHHQIKLFVAMPLAALTLIASGIQTHLTSALFPGPVGRALDIGLTLFWVVGITAAFSILDHMDGLVSGVAAIASFFFTCLAIRDGQVMVGTLGAAVLGASLGFLRWNFNPAKIFMGDGGAMFLGFMMATLGLKLKLRGAPEATSWMIPVLLLIVPILDTTLISISRTRRGLIPFTSPGKDHVAHRLAKAGLEQRGAVLALYAVGTFSGFLGLLVSGLPVESAYVLVVVVALAVLAALIALERLPYEPQEMPGDAP
jgi:UDP-GlcNAc:undecaprenyl-phosphate/decaprenyl-phosphate GlcNAc-1-phosphate transferase